MKNILLISYYFEPFNGVGAKRLSYWANGFLSEKENFYCKVLTATPQLETQDHIVFIKDPNTWSNRIVYGASWISPLENYLKTEKERFDYIIISGGPFGHFAIVSFLKRNYRSKVILDFRDPFSGNVRFGSSYISGVIKNRLERMVLTKADHVLTVNDCCREILIKNTFPEKVSVLENGYDERIVDSVTTAKISDGKIHIVHAGKFYSNLMPFALALILWNKHHPNKQYVFHHVGEKNKDLESLQSEFILQYGIRTYPETISILKQGSVGFLLTRGEFLEYNTKIFDYIGCALDIFVVTEGQIETGCINGLTSTLGKRIFWSTVKDINRLFGNYKSSNINDAINRVDYSRAAGFQKLKKILNEL